MHRQNLASDRKHEYRTTPYYTIMMLIPGPIRRVKGQAPTVGLSGSSYKHSQTSAVCCVRESQATCNVQEFQTKSTRRSKTCKGYQRHQRTCKRNM